MSKFYKSKEEIRETFLSDTRPGQEMSDILESGVANSTMATCVLGIRTVIHHLATSSSTMTSRPRSTSG